MESKLDYQKLREQFKATLNRTIVSDRWIDIIVQQLIEDVKGCEVRK